MSRNQSFKIIVRGFDSPEIGTLLLDALQRVLDDQGLTDDVFVDLMGNLGNLRVEAETPRPVIISRASVWRPKFEQAVTVAMKNAHPGAITEFDWRVDESEL